MRGPRQGRVCCSRRQLAMLLAPEPRALPSLRPHLASPTSASLQLPSASRSTFLGLSCGRGREAAARAAPLPGALAAQQASRHKCTGSGRTEGGGLQGLPFSTPHTHVKVRDTKAAAQRGGGAAQGGVSCCRGGRPATQRARKNPEPRGPGPTPSHGAASAGGTSAGRQDGRQGARLCRKWSPLATWSSALAPWPYQPQGRWPPGAGCGCRLRCSFSCSEPPLMSSCAAQRSAACRRRRGPLAARLHGAARGTHGRALEGRARCAPAAASRSPCMHARPPGPAPAPALAPAHHEQQARGGAAGQLLHRHPNQLHHVRVPQPPEQRRLLRRTARHRKLVPAGLVHGARDACSSEG